MAQSAVIEMTGNRQLACIVASVLNGTFKQTLLADSDYLRHIELSDIQLTSFFPA